MMFDVELVAVVAIGLTVALALGLSGRFAVRPRRDRGERLRLVSQADGVPQGQIVDDPAIALIEDSAVVVVGGRMEIFAGRRIARGSVPPPSVGDTTDRIGDALFADALRAEIEAMHDGRRAPSMGDRPRDDEQTAAEVPRRHRSQPS